MKKISNIPDFQKLFESAPALFLVLSPDFQIVAVDEAYLKATKKVRNEIIGRDLFEVFPDNPNDSNATGVANLKASLNRVLENKTADAMAPQKYDIPRPESEGGGFEERYWSPLNSPVIDANEELVYIIHHVEDITEFMLQKKKGAELQNANENTIRNLALIVESSDDAILSKSLDGTIISWNKGAENMYGYSSKEAIGKHISFIIPPEYINEEKEINEKIRNNETITHYETIRQRRDGEQIYVSLSASPLKNQEGNILGVSVIARDVTERKKAEDSSKLKDAFLSIISHEIRTPLNAIMGFSDILARSKIGEQEKKYASIVKSSGDDLLKIINDIIDMSKIEAGTITFAANSFSIKESFQSLNEMLIGKAKVKNLTLLFTCDQDVPNILNGDQTRLAQIITNLTNNAINFTEKGTINVRARVIKKEKENTLIEFSVSDTGIGIPLDKIKTIFARFRQIESYNKRKHGGIGLGLSIAKGLVDLQGGSISVESELNKGTTFTFSIPYKN